MADSFTATLNLRKPEVGHAGDTWGGTAGLNSDLDIIDAIFLATGLGTAVGLHVGPAQVLNVEGGITLKDPTDTTKVVALDRSLLTTATTRTLSFPDENGILATRTYLRGMVPTGSVFSGYYGNTPPTGFVFLDGLTIGDATSSATNRANADTAALFALLWGLTANAQCPVSGGRGASAAADFAFHKTLTLPDHRGRVMAGIGGTALSPAPARAATVGSQGSSAMDAPTTLTPGLGPGATAIAAGGTHIHNNVYVVQPTIIVDVVIAL